MAKRAKRGKNHAAQARGHHGGEVAKRRGKGIMKPVTPDEALAALVGSRARPRSELTRGLWAYIKSHALQDPNDGRVIRPDRPLRAVLGNKPRVSMFDMGRQLSAHVH